MDTLAGLFRQQNEKPHERVDLCRGLLGGESEAILFHWAM
jgi:hypothetical protein